MMEMAREAGYFPPALVDGLDEFVPDQFYKAIEEDMDINVGRFSDNDADVLPDIEKAKELQTIADRFDIDPKGMSNETFLAALHNAMQKQDYYDYNTSTTKGNLTEQQYKDLGDEAAVTSTYLGAMKDQQNVIAEMDADGLEFKVSEFADITSQNILLEADLQGLRNANLLPEDFDAEIKAADDLIKKSELSYDTATRAGANCLITNMRNLK